MNDRVKTFLIVVVTALAALLIGLLTDGGGETKTVPPPTPDVVHQVQDAVPGATVVDGADKDGKADDIIPVGPEAQEVVADLAVDEKDLAGDLRADTGTGPIAVPQAPWASDSIPGCRTAFLNTNWNYRSVPQSAVAILELHFTAGHDLPNSRAEVTGLTAYGNNPSARVSWHLNMDKDGNCDYNVPLKYNAWHVAQLNSYTIGIEVAGSGEAPYLREGGYRQLARIYKAVHSAYPNITLRLAASSNCRPTRSGIGTHWMGGLCSGGHTDIKPHEIQAVIAKLKTYVAASSCDKRCRKIARQKDLVKRRDAAHDATHNKMREAKCKGKIHSRSAKEYNRKKCRALKRKDIRNRKWELRARKTLRSL